MEGSCLSSSASRLHSQITSKATDNYRYFRVGRSYRLAIFCSNPLQRQSFLKTAECLCYKAKLRPQSSSHPCPLLFYTSRKELISGIYRLRKPGMARFAARSRFQVCASLHDDNNMVEESSSSSKPSTEGLVVVNDQSLVDRGRISLQETLHEIDETEMSRLEEACSATDDLEGHENRNWFQTHFIKVVRPMVRLLSGNHLSEPENTRTEKCRWQEAEPLWSIMRLLNGSLPPEYHRRKISRKLRQVESDFFSFTSHLGKFLLVMMATGTILAMGFRLAGGNEELETLIWYSWLAGIISGSMIGAEKAMEKRLRSGPRNVVITGSTRGLGKALAREFLIAGDRVVIASRSPDSVAKTVEELQNEILYQPSQMERVVEGELPSLRADHEGLRVIGMACNVSNVDDVGALADFAVSKFGTIDLWVNNAGVSKGFRPLVQFSDDDIRQIVSANLIGSLICTREAIRVMKSQPKGGHVFNMDGAGSGGSSTPLTAVYGATKCGLRQLHTSIMKECKRSRVGIHTASPGMVLTDLLLSGASLQNKKMFNIICELPETVARSLVPRMREVKGTGKAINFLTPPKIVFALITAWLRRGRWFDEEGRAVYAAEADRLRNWAEGRTRFPFSEAMDQFSENTLISVFSITVICALIMLSTTAESGLPGT